MPSNKDYFDFVCDCLSHMDSITFRKMMGEYLVYYKGIYFGGIFDNRFLVKITNENEKYNLEKVLPYKNAKLMYLVENIEDKTYLFSLVTDTYNGLKRQNESK